MKAQHTPPPALSLSFQGRQMHWLHAAEVGQIFCAEGSIRLEWQQHGLPCSAVLHAEDAPWQAPHLPAGSLIGVQQQRAAVHASATALVSQRESASWLTRLAKLLHGRVTSTHNKGQHHHVQADYKMKRAGA